ncbi:MAG: diacylglycerol kinase family protein [Chloroflexi bacterium]|nr:diacylglycerol kinase family protein [Chloroflexota bacterium]
MSGGPTRRAVVTEVPRSGTFRGSGRPSVSVKPSPPRGARPGPSWRRWPFAIGHAKAGISHAWETQPNLRIHMAVAAMVVGLGTFVGLGPAEWIAVVLCTTLVIALELVNTAVEACVDLVTRDVHPLARTAKDVAAGAVLFGAIGSLLIGAIIFAPRLYHLMIG